MSRPDEDSRPITAVSDHWLVAKKFGDVLNKLALIWTGDDKPT
jgi:hypothetical protein